MDRILHRMFIGYCLLERGLIEKRYDKFYCTAQTRSCTADCYTAVFMAVVATLFSALICMSISKVEKL